MRFFAAVAFLSSLFAFAAANQSLEALFEEQKLADAGVAAPVKARDASAENLPVLEERQSKKCPKSNGCTCKKVKQGQVRILLVSVDVETDMGFPVLRCLPASLDLRKRRFHSAHF